MTRDILAARNTEQLRATAASGALLAFDFDGTLAPIAHEATAARMRSETSELLRSLAHAAPVAVITGRSVHDVMLRLDGIPMLAVIGNHGAEPSRFAKRAAREVAAWTPMLEALLVTLPGTFLEHKRMSVSVHHWHSADPGQVIASVEALVPTMPHGVEIVHGQGLINLVPRGAPDKGTALTQLLRTHALPGALFVGDELTDEAGFRDVTEGRGMGVRVGRTRDTAATFHIATQLDIDALLTELLIGCTRPSGRAVFLSTLTGLAVEASSKPANETPRLDADGAHQPASDGLGR